MEKNIDMISERANRHADIFIEMYNEGKNPTVRMLEKITGWSKSTIHKDLAERLRKINEKKYYKVSEIFEENKRECIYRGGESTKNKYRKEKLK